MSPQRVQSLRSSTKNTRPGAGSREPGELLVNFADLQLGVINPAKVAQDLIAVRFFSATTDYVTGDFVIQAGRGYRAKGAVPAGAFNSSQWDTISVSGESEPPIAAGTVSQYWRGDKSWQTLDKAAVGLDQVSNTSDAAKPVSSAQQAALDLKANIASPTLTGNPKAPTPAYPGNDTSIATTAFVSGNFAPIISPTFGGNPAAPTPATSDNDTSIATTAYVKANLAGFAPLDSPAFTGNPTAPTPAPGDTDTSIATTAFVSAAIGSRPLDAPADGQTYGRKNNGWYDVTEEAPADGVSYGRKNGLWVASVGGAVISDTPPPGPLTPGQLWWESDSGNTFLWYDDGTSQQWIQQNIQPGSAEGLLPDMLASVPADLSYGFRAAGTPPGSANRFVWNDNVALTGTDVAAMTETGDMTLNGKLIAYSDPYFGLVKSGTYNTVQFAAPASLAWNTADSNWTLFGGTTFTTQASIFSNSNVTANSGYVMGNSNTLILSNAAATPGGVYIRTNGPYSGVGQVVIDSNGTISAGALSASGAIGCSTLSAGSTVTATSCLATSGTFTGNTSVTYFSSDGNNGGSGTVAFRPNGQNNGTANSTINSSGNFAIAGSVGTKASGTAWANPSDARIKDVTGDYTAGLAEIRQLQPRTFTYKGNDTAFVPGEPPDVPEDQRSKEVQAVPYAESPHRQMAVDAVEVAGFIAQEVETVMPALVTQGPGFIDGVEVQDFRTIDTTNLTYALINAVKELSARVEELEARLV